MDSVVEAIVRRLDEKFPDKEVLTQADVSRFTGLTRGCVRRRYGVMRDKYIDKITFAMKLVGGKDE